MWSNFFRAKRSRRAAAFAFGAAMIFALLLLFSLQGANPAHAASTFTVNSTADRGDESPGDGSCFTGIFFIGIGAECTLRAAIEEANAFSGADTITFNISGTGVRTIIPTTALPPITQRVTIDGYTQPGSSPNTNLQGAINASPLIELDGNFGTNYCSGLRVAEEASNVVIRGLVINDIEFCSGSSSASGIRLSGTGHKVEGNFIGTDASGTASKRNGRGVNLNGAYGSTIGGTSAAARNLISGNIYSGVEVFDPSGGRSGHTIQGNLIGPDKNGNPLVNSNAVLGGVVIPLGTGNRILSNSIFSNGQLGIDLGDDGVTANDGDDPTTPKPDPDTDTGPNNLQNYPLITSAQILENPFLGDTTTIVGELISTPSTKKKKRTFIIQFFSSPAGETDPSGYGEGKTFLGQKQVKTNKQGNAPISFSTEAVSEGEYITATATNKRTGDTSEFSNAERVKPLVIGPATGGG